MKNLLSFFVMSVLLFQGAFALDTVFDSMDKATEVKLAPAINNTKSSATNAKTTTQKTLSVKEEKYNNMLINLDDAQVDLRQELSVKTSEYNTALVEKQKAIQNCKNIKSQLNSIKREMKNNDKSKKMINKNLQTVAK